MPRELLEAGAWDLLTEFEKLSKRAHSKNVEPLYELIMDWQLPCSGLQGRAAQEVS